MRPYNLAAIPAAFAIIHVAQAQSSVVPAVPSLVAQYDLHASTALPQPVTPMSSNDTQQYLINHWGLAKGRFQQGGDDLAFIADPFPNTTAAADGNKTAVLEVTYQNGTYSHGTGGAQFINLWNSTNSKPYNSMLLSYELAFDGDFPWVKGGKLPGLRGGPELDECSGGDAANGTNCFSTRLMWRTNGAGEVYAYVPEQSSWFCTTTNVRCNSDGFGTSIQRGKLTFQPAQWQKLALFVQLNDPVDAANGYVALYFNDKKVIEQSNLQIRMTEKIDVSGLYFSTFFGGDDESWATPRTTHTYYRNFQLFGSSNASSSAPIPTGEVVPTGNNNGASSRLAWSGTAIFASLLAVVLL